MKGPPASLRPPLCSLSSLQNKESLGSCIWLFVCVFPLTVDHVLVTACDFLIEHSVSTSGTSPLSAALSPLACQANLQGDLTRLLLLLSPRSWSLSALVTTMGCATSEPGGGGDGGHGNSGHPIHKPQPKWASFMKTWSPFLLASGSWPHLMFLFLFYQPGPICLAALPASLVSSLTWALLEPPSLVGDGGGTVHNGLRSYVVLREPRTPLMEQLPRPRWRCIPLVISRKGTSFDKPHR